MISNWEKFISDLAAGLPRKPVAAGQKERVWTRIQMQLQSERTALAEKTAASGFWSMFRFGKLAISSAVIILTVIVVGGATKASESSLPGDTLYPVKRAAESVEKVLATTDQAKVEVGVKHAKRRLEEVRTLVAEKKDSAVVADTLKDLQSTTQQVLSVASTGQPDLIDPAVELVTQEEQVLNSVKDQTQGTIKQTVQDVLAASRESADKLKEEQVKGVTTGNGNTTSTPAAGRSATSTRLRSGNPNDGFIQSEIQIHGVTNFHSNDETNSSTPEILPEPSKGF